MDLEKRAELKKLMAAQRDSYLQMLDLVTRQEEALAGEDAPQLLTLAEKVSFIKKEAEALQNQIDPLKKMWSENREDIPNKEREGLKEIASQVQEALSQVLEKMNVVRASVDGSREETFERLKAMTRGQSAQRGYGSLAQVKKSPRFMDQNE